MVIKNILAVRNDRFGEFLLNIPAFRALKETYSGARLTLVVNPYVRELAEAGGLADEVITWDQRKHNLFEILSFSREIRKKKFDLCVILNPSREFNLIAFLSGIPRRLGYDRKWGFLLTHKIKDKKHLGIKHEVEYNLELVGAIGAKTPDTSLSLTPPDFVPKGLNIENFIAIHPWTSDTAKQWPVENFYNLTKKLRTELNMQVVVVGGREELGRSREIFGDIADSVINMTGMTTLKELVGLLKKSRLLISGDSGPVHLACCLGVPVIALFRGDIPAKAARRWGPWGDGHTVIEKNNLTEITVEEVFNKVVEGLERFKSLKV